MRPEHLALLRSRAGPIRLLDGAMKDGRIQSGTLTDGVHRWPIRNFIPRFTAEPRDSFSYQWKKHPAIMHADSGLSLYAERFRKETGGWQDLQGELVLEAGCGVGSFTQHALDTGATVLSFDISDSVDINYARHGAHPKLLISQASIFDMPFVPVDRAFCFGVLQHTPDPKAAWRSLVEKLKPGGAIATDIYADVPLTRHHGLLRAKYFLRRWTAGRDPEKLHALVAAYVMLVWPLCRALQFSAPGLQISQHLMIDRYSDRMKGMRPEAYKEYATIEIFDMLAPSHDRPATLEEFRSWHEEAALAGIDVRYGFNGLEGRGTKQ